MKLKCLANCCVVLLGLGAVWAQNASVANASKKEEIYILRSVRTSRISPTTYCAQSRTGFPDALYESRFVFRSVTTDSSHGMVLNAFGQQTGAAQACFGRTVDPDVLTFYAEGDISGQRFTGKGKCTTMKSDFPEPGLNVVTCFLELGGLKHPYVGGLLTSNTVFSRSLLGETSDPPGYVQSSIATVRLWRKAQ